MHPSTVNRVLRREGEPLLHEVDLATRRQLRGQIMRYERDRPGELVHVDIKKLGRIPDGGGHRAHGRAIGKRNATLNAAAAMTATRLAASTDRSARWVGKHALREITSAAVKRRVAR